MSKIKSAEMLSGVLVTGPGDKFEMSRNKKVFQLTGFVSTSTGAATVEVQGSLDASNWEVLDTLTLTLGTAVTSDSGVDNDAWKFIRGEVTTISGTDAEVTLHMGVND